MSGRGWLNTLAVFSSIAGLCQGLYITDPRLVSEVSQEAPAAEISSKFLAGQKQAIFTDYASTLTQAVHPDGVSHTNKILQGLNALAHKGVDVFIVSRQTVESLQAHIGDAAPAVHLVGEVGSAILSPGKSLMGRRDSIYLRSTGSLEKLRKLIDEVMEEQGFSKELAWCGLEGEYGYGLTIKEEVPPEKLPLLDSAFQARLKTSEDPNLQKLVLHRDPDDRFVAFRNPQVSKGEFVESTLDEGKYTTALSLGDQTPDEGMHKVLNEKKGDFISMVVQTPANNNLKTVAQYRLPKHEAVWNLVQQLLTAFDSVL